MLLESLAVTSTAAVEAALLVVASSAVREDDTVFAIALLVQLLLASTLYHVTMLLCVLCPLVLRSLSSETYRGLQECCVARECTGDISQAGPDD